MTVARTIAGLLLLVPPSTALAQSWNSPDVQALMTRAIERRAAVRADSGLMSFRARAHGFVFFLGQLGEGFSEPPRLIKSDQLELEVYWRAPGLSKQIIIGRRDRRDLPTDIQYHRDHLGIVQNNFGDSIRLGEGDEVRDVPHPLSPRGPSLYDYALTDSLSIELPDRAIRVYQVQVRPRTFDAPRIAGALYLDVHQAEPVRFQFNFTPPSYLDSSIEDITVVLDNALWFGRYWLPRRQEIEIRRRTSWLDLPVRGIIRGRWEIGSYQFNVPLPPDLFAPGAPEIVSLPPAARDTFRWAEPLNREILREAGPVAAADLDAVRATIERAVEHRALTGLPRSSPSFGSLSDILHVNRVQGLTPGLGWRVRPTGLRVSMGAAYGTADHRFTGRLTVVRPAGSWVLEVSAAREVRDIGDEAVIAPVLNSILAQEQGLDYGDYVLRHRATFALSRAIGLRGSVRAEAGAEEPVGVDVAARPATGRYRPNVALGGPVRGVARITVERRRVSLGGPVTTGARFQLEGGAADRPWLRARLVADLGAALGGTELTFRGEAGWGSQDLPPDRTFVLGGRGTLPGDAFRAWGGRHLALSRFEWRVPVPFPALPIGAFGNTGRRAIVVPFLAVGWAGGGAQPGSWIPTGEARLSGGIAVELFYRLLRIEFGSSFPRGGAEWTVDVRRDLWPVL